MENTWPVRCPENEEIALYLLKKRQEMAKPNGIAENLDMTLSNAYRSICSSKNPIKTMKDLSKIKGVGKWILRIMKGFFPDSPAPLEVSPSKGKKTKGPKRYVPQKNSVAYALLITLYREMANGNSFMKKQELIDAAEASGLSRTAIGPDKSKGKPGQFVSSGRDWYTGWSCMKTLVSKGLVVKSSCPAKYMLTQEGQEAARECILRSGLNDSSALLTAINGSQSSLDQQTVSHLDSAVTERKARFSFSSSSCQKELNDVSRKFGDDIVVSSDSDSIPAELESYSATAEFSTFSSMDTGNKKGFISAAAYHENTLHNNVATSSFNLRGCTSHDVPVKKSIDVGTEVKDANILAMPPRSFGENFEETYDVILILDDRENFGSRSRKVVDNIRSQFKVFVEIRRLPVGDGIWIVRHKQSNKEYVLDFIVERKKVDDLCSSIRDNRYRDQKLRLQRCGLQKLIYLVEGDPNSLEAAESIKTAAVASQLKYWKVSTSKGLVALQIQ
ncbi:crossover junction endonuclease MUS81 isoform X2 [Asparagus officinalis]|uniref:crossover junction endonuclease MUS81 isoform X2 n=1 Tax=Asparagus officinalis TaxID=4686 RepID=UPI00098DE3F0|nr:crossover junction endonuclease MUS81 isoform X2 [Asparagus officinalis]